MILKIKRLLDNIFPLHRKNLENFFSWAIIGAKKIAR